MHICTFYVIGKGEAGFAGLQYVDGMPVLRCPDGVLHKVHAYEYASYRRKPEQALPTDYFLWSNKPLESMKQQAKSLGFTHYRTTTDRTVRKL